MRKTLGIMLFCFALLFCVTGSYAEEHKHQYENHLCTQCEYPESGLYYEGEYKFTWQELIDRGYIVEDVKQGQRYLWSCSKALQGDLVVDEGIEVVMGGLGGLSIHYGFQGSQLNSVRLPSTVVELMYGVFRDSALTQVYLNEGLEKMGDDMFYRAKNLTSIVMPSTLKIIGGGTFAECDALESVEFLGEEPLEKSSCSFHGCVNLKEVDLHRFAGVIDRMFSGCSSLESMDLGENITYIGREAFAGCSNLKTLTMTEAVNGAVDGCFNSCSSLKEIRMSGSIAEYGNTDYLFSGCTQLETIQIGHGTKVLRLHSLGDVQIKKLYVPLTVTKMECLFNKCCWKGWYEPMQFDVYYEGDEFEWMLIEKANCFKNATIHYNVEY